MQIALAIRGDLRRQTAAIIKAGAQATSTVIRRKTTVLKNAQRRRITAKLGARMANTLRSDTFPATGASLNIKGRVYSKAIYKRAGGLADLLTVFTHGAVIHPVKGLFLLVGRRGSKAAGLIGRLARSKEVRIIPRINLQAEYDRIVPTVEPDIVKEYDRQLARVGG